jgi:prolyl 4-hydroxylase
MTMAQAQHITPELREWIVDQAQAGCAMQDVLQGMIRAGWQEDVALSAMEATLRSHLQAQDNEALPPASDVPWIDLAGSPLWLDAGDRQVQVVMSMQLPRVVVLAGLLSDEECDALIDLAAPSLRRSRTVQTNTGGDEINESRTSEGMFFVRGQTDLVARIEARIARLIHWPVECGEGMQVLHYGAAAEYKPHYDYFDPSEPGTPTILKRGGQRVGTVVMYLNDPIRGGATTFPDVQLEVAPRKGSAVFFSYDRPHPCTRSLHGGAPLIEGEKWVATKWLRQGEFV